jgi:hypothetical protein
MGNHLQAIDIQERIRDYSDSHERFSDLRETIFVEEGTPQWRNS